MASVRARAVFTRIAAVLFVVTLVIITALKVIYGGGSKFPEPAMPQARLELSGAERIASLPTPVVSIASPASGRLFFGLYSQGMPTHPLVEWVNGNAEPYPPLSQRVPGDALRTVAALAVDGDDKLWVLDHGHHGLFPARLVAFNLANGARVHDFELPRSLAPYGSYVSALAVGRDGRTVIMADGSFVGRNPALIVYDTQRRDARRVLERNTHLSPERYTPRIGKRRMEIFGLISVRPGVNAVTLSPDEQWLSWAVPTAERILRLPVRDLRNPALSDNALSERMVGVAGKPFSEGLLSLPDGGWLMAAPISQKIVQLRPDGRLDSWVSGALGWPGALSLGPGNVLYFSDKGLDRTAGRLPLQVQRDGPYAVYRVTVPNR